MGIRRYFEIVPYDDPVVPYIYESETKQSYTKLKSEMFKRYREGYLRRCTDGPYFLRRCMNDALISSNSHYRVG